MTRDRLFPFATSHGAVSSSRGIVATSEPTAAQAGLDILKQGGNAVDAAIATAAALTVVEPTSNGIGGDAFALVWHQGKLYGLNGSGEAPQALTIAALKKRGFTTMPSLGFESVTVPGAPAAWADLSKRFGRLSFKDALTPAIHFAEAGFRVAPVVARYWKRAYDTYRQHLTSPLFGPWFDTFAPNGAPPANSRYRLADHATTLRRIAETNAEDFYHGAIADRMDDFSQKHGGFIRKSDLQKHRTEWVTPIAAKYRGFDVYELPPNTQGLIALQALAMLERTPFECLDDDATVHRQIEALKLAFADAEQYLSDPEAMPHGTAALLDDAYIASRAALIGQHAEVRTAGRPTGSGTVYLACADSEGNMVSFIQSNYMGFGSGVVVPHTGIALQNRGRNFTMDALHPNALAPGKRAYHTIIPGFLVNDGEAVGPFGVMGGFMQPQGHIQVVTAMLDAKLNPQAALDCPRWRWTNDNTIEVEADFSRNLIDKLAARGHEITVSADIGAFGRGQIIVKAKGHTRYVGGSDKRCDGIAAAW